MVGYTSEKAVLPLVGNARGAFARLEFSADQSVRRHLGPAMAGGGKEVPFIQTVAGMPSSCSKKASGWTAVLVWLLALVGGSGYYLIGTNSSDDVAEGVVRELVAEKSVMPVELPIVGTVVPSTPLISERAPEVLVIPPETVAPQLAENVFANMSGIAFVGFTTNARPAPLPKTTQEKSLIVFHNAPVRSYVVQPQLPILDAPTIHESTIVSLAWGPAFLSQAVPRGIDAPEFGVAPKVSSDTSPRPITETEPEIPREISSRTSTSERTRDLPDANAPATRAAPLLSPRPFVAPPNRSNIAKRQIAARKAASIRKQATESRRLAQLEQRQTAISEPIPRPTLIEPKRTGLQRMFRSWGGQRTTTIEQFARENSD